MDFREILKLQLEEYDRELKRLVSGLTDEERREMPSEASHHIDFALWHASRAEDVLLNVGARETDQLWVQNGWHERLKYRREILVLDTLQNRLGVCHLLQSTCYWNIMKPVENKPLTTSLK